MTLMLQTPVDKTILAGCSFSDATQIESSNPDRDTSHLEASHVSGRYGVSPVNNQASSNFIVSQDTDGAVLLLVHFDKMKCPKLWIKR